MDHVFSPELQVKIDIIKDFRFSNPNKVIEECTSLLPIADQTKDNYLKSYVYHFWSDANLTLGQINEAIIHLHTAIDLESKYQYNDLLVKSYNLLAISYYHQGDTLLALDYYYKGLELAIKEENYIMQGMFYNNIGAIYLDCKDFRQAKQLTNLYYNVSLKDGHIDDPENIQAHKYYNLTICSYMQKKYEEAKEYISKLNPEQSNEYFEHYKYGIYAAKALVEHKLGNDTPAYELAHRIALYDQDIINKVEFFGDFIDITSLLLDLKKYEDAALLMGKLKKTLEIESTHANWLDLLSCRIRYCKETNNNELLQSAYASYYFHRKAGIEESKKSIITGIDNRLYLEQEVRKNERMEKDNKKLSLLSKKDELTDLGNRYGLKLYYEKHFTMACKKKIPFSLIILDIDCLKLYNDTYGHLQGDECIKSIAACIEAVLPTNYYAVRYGGDEFFIVSTNHSDDELLCIAAKLQDNIHSANLPFPESNISDKVTVTMGIVNSVPAYDSSVTDFIHAADSALYQVKEHTKNSFLLVHLL